jgi:hypothetical protein
LGKLSKEVHDILSSDISKAFNFDPGIAPKSEYYPHNIGFPFPAPRNYVEFAIVGQQNEKQEAFLNIVKILEEYRATVVSLTFANNQSMDQFVMNFVCDLTCAKCPADELLIRISKSKFVTFAEKDFREGKIFDSLSFPLSLFGGDVRALALDTDRVVTLFDHIGRECGQKGRQTLFEEGRVEGREIVEAIKEKLSERTSDKNLVLENVQALFQAAGWGRLSIHKSGSTKIERASIADPPADADGCKVTDNYFLQGMVAGVLEPFHKRESKDDAKLSLVKELYDSERRILTLHYMDKTSIVELSRKSEEQEARVLEKVEEVINSLEQTKEEDRVLEREVRDNDSESLVAQRT